MAETEAFTAKETSGRGGVSFCASIFRSQTYGYMIGLMLV